MTDVAWGKVETGVAEVAEEWRDQRAERQARRHLDAEDFGRLRDAGLPLAAVPQGLGGHWRSVAESTRPVAQVLRSLAGADPSVALVSAMHPAVLGYWLITDGADRTAWAAQRDAVFASALEGRQWGTITSEPGSGGDILRTTAAAHPEPAPGPPTRPGAAPALPGEAYRITGDKHFGSGSGICDLMVTTAVPEGEVAPTVFVLDVGGRPWDGTDGMRLMAEWDGVGMAATQSHSMRLESCPATRLAWDGPVEEVTAAASPFIATLFTAVVLGVLDEAVGTARTLLASKRGALRAYEQVEWSRAELDHWLAVQAFEGALRAVESGDQGTAFHAALRAKQGVAELAEATLTRLSRVIGGGTFSRRSPFSAWFEDVRALGFLRPPWGLAYDSLYATSFPPEGTPDEPTR